MVQDTGYHTRRAFRAALVFFIGDKIVQERKLRMISHVDLTPYTDEKAMKILSNQWKFHDSTGTYWPAVLECYTLAE